MRHRHSHELPVATRKTARAINRRIVLDLLRSQPVSRAELARRLGIQRSPVGRIVNELIARGLVREGAAAEAERGRKPILLHLDSRERCAVAVDVRVTRTYLAVTDLVGRELSPVASFQTDRDPSEFVRHLAQEVHALLAAHKGAGRCHGVGVAFPGMMDRTGSVVLRAPGLGWRDVPLKAPLTAALSLPVEMENAAKACALAQVWEARGASAPADIVFLSVSDGVGVGVVVGGDLLRGRHNVAGELGHLPLSIDGPRCACGATGCWEAYISNLATVSRYLGTAQPAEPVHTPVLTVEDLVDRARRGDVRAHASLVTTARYLGLGLASIVNAFDPVRIYVGGEITTAWDLIGPTVQASLGERTLVATAADTEIVVVAATEHPRLRGASALVGAMVYAAEHVA
jgi:predicted NBD/HSP70 family sugar kinase